MDRWIQPECADSPEAQGSKVGCFQDRWTETLAFLPDLPQALVPTSASNLIMYTSLFSQSLNLKRSNL